MNIHHLVKIQNNREENLFRRFKLIFSLKNLYIWDNCRLTCNYKKEYSKISYIHHPASSLKGNILQDYSVTTREVTLAQCTHLIQISLVLHALVRVHSFYAVLSHVYIHVIPITVNIQICSVTTKVSLMEGVPNLWDLVLDGLRWSWCNNNRNKVHNKCNVLESSWNHPLTPIHANIVFHKTGPWFQKVRDRSLMLPLLGLFLCLLLSREKQGW